MNPFSAATALYIGDTAYSAAYLGDVKVWPAATDYSRQYTTMEILSGGSITWSEWSSTHASKTIEYSKNGGAWTAMLSTNGSSVSVSAGDIVRWRGTNRGYCNVGSTGQRASFNASSAYYNLYGNIMSLIYGDNFIGQTTLDSGGYNFVGLFRQNKVIDASNFVIPADVLPERALINLFIECPNLKYAPKTIAATDIGVAAMQGVFANCSSLETTPERFGTTVAASGYSQTFNNCAKITTAPELPATTVGNWGYYAMFAGCGRLKYIKCMATSGGTNAFYRWCRQVASTGTFVKKTGSTWASGENGIPNGWTVQEE